MNRAWLLKRIAYLGVLIAVSLSVIVVMVRGWDRVIGFLDGGWPL